jgi:hypothetical protein
MLARRSRGWSCSVVKEAIEGLVLIGVPREDDIDRIESDRPCLPFPDMLDVRFLSLVILLLGCTMSMVLILCTPRVRVGKGYSEPSKVCRSGERCRISRRRDAWLMSSSEYSNPEWFSVMIIRK